MDKYRVEKEERLHIRRSVSYKYYDTPDGEDLPLKLFYTGKYALWGGILLGLIDAYVKYPLPSGPIERLARCGKYVVPFVGITSAFTVTTFYATKWRGKDDEINYIFGGIAAGSVVGAAMGRTATGFYVSILFSSIGYTKKYCEVRNTKIWNPKRLPKSLSPYYKKKWDFSLVPNDIRGNWTREPKK